MQHLFSNLSLMTFVSMSQPGQGPSRGLLRDCKIFVSSSSIHQSACSIPAPALHLRGVVRNVRMPGCQSATSHAPPGHGTAARRNIFNHVLFHPSLPWDWEQEGWLHVLFPGPDQECICSSVRPLYFIRTLKYVQRR